MLADRSGLPQGISLSFSLSVSQSLSLYLTESENMKNNMSLSLSLSDWLAPGRMNEELYLFYFLPFFFCLFEFALSYPLVLVNDSVCVSVGINCLLV